MLFLMNESFKINGYTFHSFTKDNVGKLLEFLYTLDISDVNFEAYIPMYFNSRTNCYKFIDSFLCIFDYNNGKILLENAPIGNGTNSQKLSVLKKCVKLMYIINHNKFDLKISWFTESFLSFFNKKKIRRLNNFCEEFIYSTKSLREVQGKKFKSIRNSINRFEKLGFEFREYTDNDYKMICDLYQLWQVGYESKMKLNPKYGEKSGVNDKDLFLKYIKNRKMFRIKIYSVFDSNKMIGCIGITRLCKNSSIILFEKCDNSYNGICEYMWIKAVREFDFYEYECDGDGGTKKKDGTHVTGLYDYKMRFNPVEVREMYSLVIANKDTIITNNFFGGNYIEEE